MRGCYLGQNAARNQFLGPHWVDATQPRQNASSARWPATCTCNWRDIPATPR